MLRNLKKNRTPEITAVILLHSISKTDFEVDDIEFIDAEYDKLEKEYGSLNGKAGYEKKLKNICGQLCRIDGIREMAAEDIGDHGEVSKDINEELWQKNQVEKTYKVIIALWYTTTQDYFGEVDVDVDCEYEGISYY